MNFETPTQFTHHTKKDLLAKQLIEMISTGLLQDNDTLPSERELSKIFGVSRETVRGALNTIAAYGLIQVSQGTKTKILYSKEKLANFLGAQMPLLDINTYNIDDVFVSRFAIETAAIKRSVHLINQAQIDQLYQIVDMQTTMYQDPVRFQLSDEHFHTLIAKICNNELLVRYTKELYHYGLIARRAVLSNTNQIKQSVVEHQAIVDSLQNRNEEQSVAALQQHLQSVYDTTKQFCSANPAYLTNVVQPT